MNLGTILKQQKSVILTISKNEEPDLFFLVQSARKNSDLRKRLTAYADSLSSSVKS